MLKRRLFMIIGGPGAVIILMSVTIIIVMSITLYWRTPVRSVWVIGKEKHTESKERQRKREGAKPRGC